MAPAGDAVGRRNCIRRNAVSFAMDLSDHSGGSGQVGDGVDEDKASSNAIRGVIVGSKRLDCFDINQTDVVKVEGCGSPALERLHIESVLDGRNLRLDCAT